MRTKIETHHQILAPAYRVSLNFQKNSTIVAETIPYVNDNQKLEKLDLLAVRMKLCQHLIACVKYEFHSEINSTTNQVWFSKSLFYLDR